MIPSLFSDSAGRSGDALLADAHLVLFKDGTKIHEFPSHVDAISVPTENGRYRLEIQAKRTAIGTVS